MARPSPIVPAIRDATLRWLRIGLTASLAICLAGCGGEESENPETEIKATLMKITRPPTPPEIAPYDEALVINEYQVDEILRGPKLAEERIRVARWAILDNTPQAPAGAPGNTTTMTLVPLDSVPGLETVQTRDDLAFDPEATPFLDLSQSLSASTTPRQLRYDYRTKPSAAMRTYWQTRAQLKLAIVGNSHAACAVDPQLFFLPENAETPVALNLSPAGAGIHLQCLLINDYLADLPALEWVIWGVSPRLFNDRAFFDRRHELFTTSPGYLYDRNHWDELWPVDTDQPPMTVEALKESYGPWRPQTGWTPNRESKLKNPLDEAETTRIQRLARSDRFRDSPESWQLFEAALEHLQQEGIRVLLFIPPYHPLFADTKAADVDGTGHRHYEEIVSRLSALAEGNPFLIFQDFHQGGNHEFAHEAFSDADHLMDHGATRLTEGLIRIVDTAAPLPESTGEESP